MPIAPIPSTEQERLNALYSYNILDTASEEDFDELTGLASAICNTPIALISFVDKHRQWFKSHNGLDVTETDRAMSFCAYAINEPTEILEVEDAEQDLRFSDNPLVTGDMNLTFYAGVPLVNADGAALGSLCVINYVPQKLNDMQRKALKILAKQVIDKLELRRKLLDAETTGQRILELNNLLLSKEREAIQIVQHAPSAMALHVGEAMTIRFANKRMLDAWGKDESVFGQAFQEALPELSKLDFPRTMRKVYQKGIIYEQNEAHMLYEHRGEIREFYYNYAFTPLTRKDGTVWGILNTALDVTQSVKDRLAVEQAEEELRLAIQSAELGTWKMNIGTLELTASKRFKELFGFYPDEEITYEAVIGQVEDGSRNLVIESLATAMKEGKSFDLEYPIVGFHDGKFRWVRTTGKLVKSINGSPTQFSGIVADITERKQDEQRKNDFITVVSHELKTPLTSMKGYLQVIEMKARKVSAGDVAEIAKKAQRQTDRMQEMITGFLDVARITEGKILLNQSSFDINSILQSAEDDVTVTVKSGLVKFTRCEQVFINGDKGKIEQVLLNLVNNAIKYSPREPIITVSCIKEENNAVIRVIDRGLGIHPADLPNIFERFYRVDHKDVKMIAGFGIGLYICKEIIERHGGSIGVNSVLGEGSEFWFKLPIAV
ncbi:PAS domain S-box protein [Mucilaginibacter conchicola]|uniref:histidine kinase n=1 Tax=Mucilaginibacter conchicola TaxID=2303333 RepID=A0A372NQR1_9SPHI|nr:ATP-binding protein [Mucilaginibacter conchicola]RFZ91289.1 PAS domain S-box protein [Mucilaginibacter conchicola]